MGLESTTTIAGLVQTNPVASDALGQADDHIRLVKTVLKTIFPGSGGAGFSTPITASEAELNYVDGVTSAIQTQLNTISAAAATADGKAVTADGKAVAAQNDATDALADAATAQNGANLALSAASVADGKAVDAQADATQAIADAAAALAAANSKADVINAARAWCVFNGTLTGSNAPIEGNGISAVERISTGRYIVTFSSNQTDIYYGIIATSTDGFMQPTAAEIYVGSFEIKSYTHTGTLVDASRVCIMILSAD